MRVAMITLSLAAVLMSLQSPAAPPPVLDKPLSTESKALLRCSAAFAMVAHGQENGNEAALKWPDLKTRGREFFVRSLAQLMDDTGLDRDGISQLVSAEAQTLWDEGQVEAIMPSCLLMLEGSKI
ncbi:hypothetical protein AUC45_10925 [Erythrobacter sp. YT30]|nr:hypothetical protein AUC45_10925 [Erythrobacter sp. YT30]